MGTHYEHEDHEDVGVEGKQQVLVDGAEQDHCQFLLVHLHGTDSEEHLQEQSQGQEQVQQTQEVLVQQQDCERVGAVQVISQFEEDAEQEGELDESVESDDEHQVEHQEHGVVLLQGTQKLGTGGSDAVRLHLVLQILVNSVTVVETQQHIQEGEQGGVYVGEHEIGWFEIEFDVVEVAVGINEEEGQDMEETGEEGE